MTTRVCWRVRSTDLLKAGFGVEDISVKLAVPLADVQFLVRSLRASGKLAKMFEVAA